MTPFYVRATYTTGRRSDGDGWDVREAPVAWYETEAEARARVAVLVDGGFSVCLGAVLALPGIPAANYAVEDSRGARLPRVPEEWRRYVVGGAS